jgi:hypothetical protein
MATLDVIAYDRARQALRIGVADASRRDELERAITAVSQHLDEMCGPIVQRTITEVIDTTGCEHRVSLSAGPVSSITSVTFYDDGVSEVLTAESLATAGGYLAELQQRIRPDGTSQLLSGVLRKRGTFADETWDKGRVQVVYVAGRYANTAAVQGSRFELAALTTLEAWAPLITGQRVAATEGEYALPFNAYPRDSIPAAALNLVAADRVHIVGIA